MHLMTSATDSRARTIHFTQTAHSRDACRCWGLCNINADCLSRIASHGVTLRNNHRNWRTQMANIIACQQRDRPKNRRASIITRQIRLWQWAKARHRQINGRHDFDNTRHGASARNIQRRKMPACNLGPQKYSMQNISWQRISNKAACTAQQPLIFHSGNHIYIFYHEIAPEI
jgi:hypothetical protein